MNKNLSFIKDQTPQLLSQKRKFCALPKYGYDDIALRVHLVLKV